MIKSIITNKKKLAIPSDPIFWTGGTEPEAKEHINQIIQDLLDTAQHHQAKPIGCVGLAGNQIGYLDRIIVVWNGASWISMVNPEIVARDGKMGSSHESCLSRPGVRVKVKRHKRIKVQYMDENFVLVKQKFSHFTARVIQHEVAHLDGKYIG